MPHQNQRGRTGRQDRAETDGNVCVECNARFARLEHLKRHMVSLHSSQDPRLHQCNLCGKRFSRKDVLLRHQQSCRAEKPDDESQGSPKGNRTSKLTCQKCKTSECSCSPNDLRRLSMNVALPSPPTDVSQARTESTGSLLSPEQVTTGLAAAQQTGLVSTYGSANTVSSFATNFGIPISGSPEVLWSNWTQRQPLENGPIHTGTSTLDEANPCDALSQHSGTAVTDDNSSKERKRVNKRGRYVPQACINCQKRKIKCSGEETCQQCHAGDEVCIYQPGRKRRATLTTREENAKTTTGGLIEVQSSSQDSALLASSLAHVLERVAALEKEADTFKKQVATMNQGQPQDELVEASLELEDSSMSSAAFPSDLGLPGSGTIHGPTSIVQSITALNKMHDEDADTFDHYQHQNDDLTGSRAPSVGWEKLPRGRHKNLATLSRETRSLNRAILYREVHIFFENLNPHYPCLNEAQFRNSLEEFFSRVSDQDADVDQIQFVALLNLVCAEVKMLHDSCTDSEKAPGWDEFCRAETILNSLTWLGNGNAMTIQCLIIKAKYLLYMERSEAAYDAITRAARLCFKLKYSNQDSWSSCSPFEVVMRQRIMWTTFYFERNVALNSGIPYLIREVDLRVELPKCYNDKSMSPDQPLPEEDPINSYGPCLAVAVKWGKLCAEIWDTLFAVSVQKPVNQELVASIEARILYTVGQLPLHLLWHRHAYRLHEIDDLPLFVLRQSIILYLRVNQLRLLLRQDSMLSMEYDIKTATECISIAIGSIDAIHNYINSDLHRTTDRFSSVLYLQGAILSLVCIIFKSSNPAHLRTSAIDAFKKGLQLINQLRPNYALARHALSSIHRIIQKTNRAISRYSMEDGKDKNHEVSEDTDPMVSFDVEDFEAHMDHLLMNKEQPPMPDENLLGSTFDGSLSYTLMNPIVHDFNMTNELDSLWLDPEFLKTQQMMFTR